LAYLCAYAAKNAPAAITAATGTYFASYATNGGDGWEAFKDASIAGGIVLATGVPASMAAERIGQVFSNTGVAGIANVATQLVDMARGARDELNPVEPFIAMTAAVPIGVSLEVGAVLGINEIAMSAAAVVAQKAVENNFSDLYSFSKNHTVMGSNENSVCK
jgi:hypothetical protein